MNESIVFQQTGNEHIITSGNNLFPVFLKLETLHVLIVGGGNVGLEKLQAVLQNSPATKINLVSIRINDQIKELAQKFNTISIYERPFNASDLESTDVVIIAVNDTEASTFIRSKAKEAGKLVNVADQPDLCDFYMGSIVKKGNLKIAISTNGKSPTIAKRLREVINNMIPDEMESVLNNMQHIRNNINGDFNEKVKQLNDLTKVLIAKQVTLQDDAKTDQKKWSQIVTWCLLIFICMILGHAILSYLSVQKIVDGFKTIPQYVDRSFLIMLVTGFAAQMVDGSLGMGYGTISTTFLLAYGVNPAIVSSKVHSARVFSSGISGYTHHRFKNINKKLFRALVVPGIIGALIGASLAFLGQRYVMWVRIPLSIYTLYLGYFIIKKAFKKKSNQDKVKRAGWLASAGGFLDAFAGGGWGTLVTSTLIAKRKTPRYVIGSVCLAEFFVVLVSSITFFILLKSIPLMDVLGLILGGIIAAPIAARLVGKLPLKKMYVAVGVLVILTSCSTMLKSIFDLIK
ncbi:MAG: TSUP family transporter [Flavisolibacter sp.]